MIACQLNGVEGVEYTADSGLKARGWLDPPGVITARLNYYRIEYLDATWIDSTTK